MMWKRKNDAIVVSLFLIDIQSANWLNISRVGPYTSSIWMLLPPFSAVRFFLSFAYTLKVLEHLRTIIYNYNNYIMAIIYPNNKYFNCLSFAYKLFAQYEQ